MRTKGKLSIFLSITMIFSLMIMSFPSIADPTSDYEETFTLFVNETVELGEATFIIDNNELTISVNIAETHWARGYHLYILDAPPDALPTPDQADFDELFEPDHFDQFTIGPVPYEFSPTESGQCLSHYIVLQIDACLGNTYPGTIVDSDSDNWFRYVHVEICNAEVQEDGALTIFKFNDLNDDGLYDSGEPALEGIYFELYDSELVELENSPFITDSEGLIELENLPAGDYRIKELSDYEITTPVFADGYYTATVAGNETTTVTVGNYIAPTTGSIKIIKFRDYNRDGENNNNDYLLDGIQFKLEKVDSEDVWTYRTGQQNYSEDLDFNTGEIIFSDLPYGDYLLSELTSHAITTPEALKTGPMTIHIPTQENIEVRIDDVEIEVGNYWSTSNTTVTDSTSDITGSVSVHKFLDTDKNNLQGDSEFDMQYITFELYESDRTTLLDSKTTDEDGNLTFTELPFDTYYLKEISDYEITSPEFGADGFIKTPVVIASAQTLQFNIGNARNIVEQPVMTETQDDNEVAEISVPEAQLPLGLPQTGEVPPTPYYVLGALLTLAGIFLKRSK